AKTVPSLTRSSSGSKSQPGSGFPAAALENKSCRVVLKPSAPSATLRQKSGPNAALKVIGSHPSRATICATLDGFSCAPAYRGAAGITKQTNRLSLETIVFKLVHPLV